MGAIVCRNDFIPVAAGGKRKNPANPSFVGITESQRVVKRRTLPTAIRPFDCVQGKLFLLRPGVVGLKKSVFICVNPCQKNKNPNYESVFTP
jgi:hypothetical protein